MTVKKRLLITLSIIAMLLPLLFVWVYGRSKQANDEPPPIDYINGDEAILNENGESLTEVSPEPEEELQPDEPGIEEPEEPEEIEEEPEEEPEPEVEYIGVAYLTFDDGPSREVTPGILDLLLEEDIRATFFVLPREGFDDLFNRMINEGHEIGNHSFSHNYGRLYRQSIDAFTNDITRASEFITDNFGYTMTSFRFPGGSMTWNRDVRNARIAVVEELGYTFFDWHIDSGDANTAEANKGAGALAANVLNNTGGREHVIILMHDFKWRASTLEALPTIINGLREQGYRFDIMQNYPVEEQDN